MDGMSPLRRKGLRRSGALIRKVNFKVENDAFWCILRNLSNK